MEVAGLEAKNLIDGVRVSNSSEIADIIRNTHTTMIF